MEIKILSKEKGMAEILITLPGEDVKKAVDEAYDRHKDDEGFSLPREGIDRDPVGVPLMQEAMQALFTGVYGDVMRRLNLPVASEPRVSVRRAGEEMGAEFYLTFALRPEVKLGQYKGLRVKMPEIEPTEEEYRAAIDQVESDGQKLSDEQKRELREAVAQRKRQLADQAIEDQVLKIILEEARVDIPPAMVESEANICVRQFAQELSAGNMTLQQFCEQNGKTEETVHREMMPLAERRIRLRLVLSAIAEAEGFRAEDSELQSALEQMAAQFGMMAEELREKGGQELEAQLRAEIVSEKAYALLRESTILEAEED